MSIISIAGAVPSWVGPLIGVIVGFLLNLVGGWVKRHLYRPRLSLKFNPSGPYVVDGPEESPECRWARVSVTNYGRTHLKHCQAFITNIERERAGNWGKTNPEFSDPLTPEWAATDAGRFKPRDLPRSVPFYINLLTSESMSNRLTLSAEHMPNRLSELFKEHARYRVTVTVTGDQVKPEGIRVIVNWTGSWKFDVARDPS